MTVLRQAEADRRGDLRHPDLVAAISDDLLGAGERRLDPADIPHAVAAAEAVDRGAVEIEDGGERRQDDVPRRHLASSASVVG